MLTKKDENKLVKSVLDGNWQYDFENFGYLTHELHKGNIVLEAAHNRFMNPLRKIEFNRQFDGKKFYLRLLNGWKIHKYMRKQYSSKASEYTKSLGDQINEW